MRKALSIFLILALLLGLFTGCSSPSSELSALTRQLSEMDGYTFTAVGEVIFTEGATPYVPDMPLSYEITGVRFADGDLSAQLNFTDALGRRTADISFTSVGGINYLGFIPFFQEVMDELYAPYTAIPISESFFGYPYLTDPGLNLENLPINFPALIDALDNRDIRYGLSQSAGLYSLHLTGDQLSPSILATIVRPFGLYSDLYAYTLPAEEMHFDPLLGILLAGDLSEYLLELTFTLDEETSTFTMWLTLIAPGLMEVRADVVYQEIPTTVILPPADMVDLVTMQYLFAAYQEANARALFIAQSGIEIIQDLPELHMTEHEESNLLIPFDMEIGDTVHTVSLMVGASNTASHGYVHSFTPAMAILYTTRPAHSASETMAPIVLEDFGVEAYDAENFQRTAMRVNAHDTAAVKALYFDDNHMGRTLHIYVLQNLDDSDYALFMGIIVILDSLTAHAYRVLEELGFLIGIDFQDYLTLAQGD